MENVYKQALKYVNEYKWSVIPIRSDGSKAPALQSWKEYRERYPSPEELKVWFQNQNNWMGIVPGSLSRLSVADVDSKKNTDLFHTPLSSHTPRGRHFYFKYNDQLKNWVKPTNSDWDVRTEGGYVVCPPSPNYRWNNPFFSADIVGRLPEFPLHLLPKKEVENRPPLKRSGRIGELLADLREGNRDSTFTSLIGLMHNDGYAADDIAALLIPYATSSNFGVLELEKKIKHILSTYESGKKQNDEASEDVSAFLQDVTPVRWIVPNVIARSSIGFVAGLPETFKTWLTLDLAIECARGGGKWLGRFDAAAAKVLFIDQERHKSETQRRFNCLLNAKGLNPKLLSNSLFIKCGSTTRLDLDESFRAFKSRLAELQPEIVIVDSFATFHVGGENDRQEIQKMLERVKELRDEFGCTFLFIDHENKSVFSEESKSEAPNAYRMVGSVGKVAAAEMMLTVRKYDPQTCMVYQTKNTLAPCIESFNVSVNDVPNGVVVSSHD